jgi:multiple sugar transport system substrate-binding protein
MRRILTLCAAALVFAGCGDDDTTTTSSDGGKEISFQVFGSPDEFPLYEKVAEAFTEKTGTKVDLIEVADEEAFATKLATSISAGKAPDVALVSYRGFKRYAAKDEFLPLEGVDASAYYEQPIEAFTYEGKLQCLPQNLSSLVVYYNADLLKKAGVEDPADDWTMEDLLAAAQKVQGTETDDGEAFGVSIEKELIRLAPFVWSAGGEVMDDQEDPTKLTLDTPEARQGIEDYLALAKLGPSTDEEESESEDQLFLEGRLGFVLASRKKVPTYRKAAFGWDVAPFPGKTTVLHTDGFCVLKGAGEAAMEFAKFAGGEEGQKILTDLGRVVPSIRSLAESDQFLKSKPPANNQVYVDAAEKMRILPTHENSPAIEITVERALEQAYFGRITAEEFVERVEEETRAAFEGELSDEALEEEEEREREEEEREEREREEEG